MQNPLPHETRKLLTTGAALATPDLAKLIYDERDVFNTMDVLDALLGGKPFFIAAQLLDGLAENGVRRHDVDQIVHLLGTVSCSERQLKELIEALCLITEYAEPVAA
jgi:hypothetical protein